jgi:hypothetical protein
MSPADDLGDRKLMCSSRGLWLGEDSGTGERGRGVETDDYRLLDLLHLSRHLEKMGKRMYVVCFPHCRAEASLDAFCDHRAQEPPAHLAPHLELN